MTDLLLKAKILRDTRGQDLIEYALMAGFVALAAGAVMPGTASGISTILSSVGSSLNATAQAGSVVPHS
jgi:pilus assembly protein Flp/PilA